MISAPAAQARETAFSRRRRGVAIVTLGLALSTLVATPAAATFAGRDGAIAEAWLDNDQGAHSEANYAIVTVPWLKGSSRGHNLRSCTSLDACPEFSHPAYSPDGARLVFAEIPNVFGAAQTSELVLTDPGGGHQVVVSAPDANLLEPSFAPSGHRLVFVRSPLPPPAAGSPLTGPIVTSNLAGTDVRVVTNLSSSDPVMSPDGRTVLFVHAGDIWSAGTNGTNAHRLITNASMPDFSPSGRKLVYASGHQYMLYLAHADGTHRSPLLRRAARRRPSRLRYVDYPVFSPDAKQIAFATTSLDGTGGPALVRIPIGSGHLRMLWTTGTLDSGGTDLGTAWRPLR